MNLTLKGLCHKSTVRWAKKWNGWVNNYTVGSKLQFQSLQRCCEWGLLYICWATLLKILQAVIQYTLAYGPDALGRPLAELDSSQHCRIDQLLCYSALCQMVGHVGLT